MFNEEPAATSESIAHRIQSVRLQPKVANASSRPGPEPLAEDGGGCCLCWNNTGSDPSHVLEHLQKPKADAKWSSLKRTLRWLVEHC